MAHTVAHSHAEPANLACPNCGEPFDAEVWVIVDVEERPDLLALIRQGTLHDLRCPHCGHVAALNAPLLILRPSAAPPLLFSPARGAGEEQNREQAEALVGMCREHLGPGWRDDWLAEGLHGAAREALPLLLGDDPDVAAALAGAVRAADEVPPAVRRALEEIMALLAAEGARVSTPDDLKRALEERPELKARLARALAGEK